MNEQLEIRLGEYLLSEGVRFDHVEDVIFDEDEVTIDIWYLDNSRTPTSRWFSVRDERDFFTFLVTGGK
ncbi:MAG TPA: hypothetical protein VIY48_14385 [Candidatus Paceibacterota bacterium]